MPKNRILIVDDDPAMVNALTIRSQALGLEVDTAQDSREALERIRQSTPDLICMDVNMPWGGGLRLCETLAASNLYNKVPTIVITGDNSEETIRKCYNLSVIYIEKSTDMWQHIETMVGKLLHLDRTASPDPKPENTDDESKRMPTTLRLRGNKSASIRLANCQTLDSVFETLDLDEPSDEKETSPPNTTKPPLVLCIEDDAAYSMALQLRLEARGVAVIRAFDGAEGLRSACGQIADVILLDYEMPNGRGDEILQHLKANPATKNIPVIVITGINNQELESKLLALGAEKFIAKPVDFRDLAKELTKHIPTFV